MKLYTLPGAPNPTKVMLFIAEKEALGVDLGVEQVVVNVFKGEHKQPAYLEKSPFGTMPALELSSGEFVFESLAIMETLDEVAPEPSLWGATFAQRAVNRTLERVADARVLVPTATYVHAVNSPLGFAPDEAVAERSKVAFTNGLRYLNGVLADGRDWLGGSSVSVADCTLQGALQFMRFRELEDLREFPHIAAWSERYRARPTAQDVLIF